MFWKFIVFEKFGGNEITGFALLIMQKSHSKISQVQYACVETVRNARKPGRF